MPSLEQPANWVLVGCCTWAGGGRRRVYHTHPPSSALQTSSLSATSPATSTLSLTGTQLLCSQHQRPVEHQSEDKPSISIHTFACCLADTSRGSRCGFLHSACCRSPTESSVIQERQGGQSRTDIWLQSWNSPCTARVCATREGGEGVGWLLK